MLKPFLGIAVTNNFGKTLMLNLKNYTFKIVLSFLLLFSLNAFGQDIFSANQDLSKLRAEDLTETQIGKIKVEMKKRNLTIDDLQTLALSKGMSPVQFAILSDRLKLSVQQELSMSETADAKEELPKNNQSPGNKTTVIQSEKYKKIFGSEIFSNAQLSFEPNQSLATPGGYVLGPGDELEIILYGMQQFQQTARISKEGFVAVSNVGNIKVGGLQFGAALELLKKKCGTIYTSLKSGASELSVSLTNFKTIQVTIIGAQSPGNYNVSSLATVFNALHAAGGPGENGSFRSIELIRKGKVIKVIDLYSFLSKGDVSGNLNLQNDDIIRVPPYFNRVEIEGEVKRPGIFELKNGEGFKDLLSYCSGYTENAYHGAVSIVRMSEKKKKIVTIDKVGFDTLKLESGDLIRVDQVLDLYENRILVKGAVYHPGEYELIEGMRISDLVSKADGFREDAYLERALLIRERPDMLKEVVGVDLHAVKASPGSVNDLLLKNEDELVVPSAFDFEENRTVEINGEILNPGKFPFIRKMKLYDLIIQSGGMKQSAAEIVEISRVTNTDSTGLKIEAEIITLNVVPDLSNDSSNIELMPFDNVSIRKKSSYNFVNSVRVEGEVMYPGKYGIGEKNERISSIIERAGGLNDKANPSGVKIIRTIEYVNDLDSMKVDRKVITVPVDYRRILKNSKHKSNVRLLPGDKIVIERLIQTVKVVGEVELNSQLPKVGNKRAKYYINSAGGFKEGADKSRVYVVYANGFAKKTKHFLFFKVYPKPEFGSQVVVTKKAENKNKLSTGEVVGISSVLSSITGMTIALINLLQP
jgi:protein involved in polysaccharide export with SLBB domain